MRGHWFALQANQSFFTKRKQKKIELVARPGRWRSQRWWCWSKRRCTTGRGRWTRSPSLGSGTPTNPGRITLTWFHFYKEFYAIFFFMIQSGPWFSKGHCDLTDRPHSNLEVANARYGHCLSTDTIIWFDDGQVVWSRHIVKLQYFLMFFVKSHACICTHGWNFFCENLFLNCSQTKTVWWKCLKTTSMGHKYPITLYPEKFLKIIEPFLSYLSLKCAHFGAFWVVCPYLKCS